MIDLRPTKCNLCGRAVVHISNAVIYGRKYGSGYCYLCTSCGAFVGTHVSHPEEALGILADENMRKAKIRYTREELHIFADMLGDIMMACQYYEDVPHDVMGELFHELEMHNKWHGQFFTPMHIASLMGELQMFDIDARLAEQDYITVSEIIILILIQRIEKLKSMPLRCNFLLAV